MTSLVENVDETVAQARSGALKLIEKAERHFVDSVTERGALTTEQALKVLDEQRPAILEELDQQMKELRAWILRGGNDQH